MKKNPHFRHILLGFITLCCSAQLSAAKPGEQAPDFNLAQLKGGESIQLSQFRGKVVFLDFWASWCGPCRQSLPLFNTFYAELNNAHFEIVAINLDENSEDGLAFLKKYPVDYLTLADPAGVTPALYQLPGMPSSFLIDRKGIIRAKHIGFKSADMDKIKSEIKHLLGESS